MTSKAALCQGDDTATAGAATIAAVVFRSSRAAAAAAQKVSAAPFVWPSSLSSFPRVVGSPATALGAAGEHR